MFKFIENYLPQEDFLKIKNHIVNNIDFKWQVRNNVAFYDKENKSELDDYYLFSLIYNNYQMNSIDFNTLVPLFKKIDPKVLIRVKANAYPNINKFKEHSSHIDFDYSHLGAIYYLNTNNGYTILDYCNEKIPSIENSILFFDASKLHKSTNCTDKKFRYNININYF